jgi:glycosyltransferase involved in cell wall biosynthesis
VREGIVHYPADGIWGNETLATYANDHKADLVIALCDAWVLRPTEWDPGPPVAVWAPIDHFPPPPAVLAVLSNERIRPIAMSRNGEQLLREAGLDPAYVPHGINTRLFCPRPEVKRQARDILQIPQDAFLVGMVAANKANPPRKGFPQAFHAFTRFARDHDDAWMYVHTQPKMEAFGGIDLDVLATAIDVPAGRLRFPPDSAWHLGIGRDIIAVIYQAFDVLLNPSMGEGFGIPIIEAQACGVPVIASNHSAMTELTQAGWLVHGDPWWNAAAKSFQIIPAIDGIVAALEDAYERRDDQELRAAAARFATGYEADRVTSEFWVPALEKLGRSREVAPLVLNREQRRAARRRKVAV